jgi:phospholipid/cholesterol/gamma-HCH transport system substrate-binding protein
MRRNALETAIGALVIAAAVGFLAFSYMAADIGNVAGYKILARFDRIDGLKEGSEVRMSGIRIGQIKSLSLEQETYFALVEMEIDDAVKLPEDSSAAIISESLLGGRFMALTPGGASKYLSEGDEIRFTQSPVSLEQLIGKFIFAAQDEDKKQ